MARGKKYQPEQVVNLLRQIEVSVANGKLKRLVANLSLEKLVLKDIAS
jgi:hypothetical protein